MYGRMGRRRRRARELGPTPKLYEFDLHAEDKQDGDSFVGLAACQVSLLRSTTSVQSSEPVTDVHLPYRQPFSLFHPTLNPIIPVPPRPSENEPRYLVNRNINVPRDYRNTRYLTTRQHWQSISYPPSSYPPPTTSSTVAGTRAGAEATDEEQRHRGDVWIERVTRLEDHQDDDHDGTRYDRRLPLEASFLIKMPESESTARFRRRMREEEGEEMLHPPIEVAIWKGVLQR